MKKMMNVLVAGAMVAALFTESAVTAFATAPKTTDPICCSMDSEEWQDINAYLDEFDFLTDADKQQLVASEKKLEPEFRKLDDIDKQISTIFDSIMDKDSHLMDEYDRLLASNQDLWDKLEENITDEQAELMDTIAFINASNALTPQEKEILVKEQKKLDEIDTLLDERWLEAEKATEQLCKQADEIYERIEKEVEANRSIWDKIDMNTKVVPVAYCVDE